MAKRRHRNRHSRPVQPVKPAATEGVDEPTTLISVEESSGASGTPDDPGTEDTSSTETQQVAVTDDVTGNAASSADEPDDEGQGDPVEDPGTVEVNPLLGRPRSEVTGRAIPPAQIDAGENERTEAEQMLWLMGLLASVGLAVISAIILIGTQHTPSAIGTGVVGILLGLTSCYFSMNRRPRSTLAIAATFAAALSTSAAVLVSLCFSVTPQGKIATESGQGQPQVSSSTVEYKAGAKDIGVATFTDAHGERKSEFQKVFSTKMNVNGGSQTRVEVKPRDKDQEKDPVSCSILVDGKVVVTKTGKSSVTCAYNLPR